MPSYKLSYFDLKGLGESIRMLLTYGGATFEDVRVTFEQWPALKPTMPFGQMPVLEIDGKVCHQSLAICRYLGKQFGIAGSNDLENLDIDAVVDSVNDIRKKISEYYWNSNEEEKNKMGEQLKESVPFYFGKFDELAKANNGHLAVGKLTWADIHFMGIIDYMNFCMGEDLLEKYPNLQKVRDNVKEIPSLKKWIETRPVTDL